MMFPQSHLDFGQLRKPMTAGGAGESAGLQLLCENIKQISMAASPAGKRDILPQDVLGQLDEAMEGVD